MCGRFVLFSSLDDIVEAFGIQQIEYDPQPSCNVAPTQTVATVIDREDVKVLTGMVWGLIPSWAKDPGIGSKMINARSETVDQKPSFKRSFAERRCLVLADGFFEWQKTERGKRPVYIRLKSQRPFGFAGLYDCWKAQDGNPVHSCTIITTEPNQLLQPIHNRMPVIVPRSDENLWLDPSLQDPDQLQVLLKPYPSEEMESYPVSRLVNSPRNNSPECVQSLAL